MLLGDVAGALWSRLVRSLRKQRQRAPTAVPRTPQAVNAAAPAPTRGAQHKGHRLRTRTAGGESRGFPRLPPVIFIRPFQLMRYSLRGGAIRKTPFELSRARRDTQSHHRERGARGTNREPGRAVASGPHAALPDRSVSNRKS